MQLNARQGLVQQLYLAHGPMKLKRLQHPQAAKLSAYGQLSIHVVGHCSLWVLRADLLHPSDKKFPESFGTVIESSLSILSCVCHEIQQEHSQQSDYSFALRPHKFKRRGLIGARSEISACGSAMR
eukprot:6488469-Amphidinium_carterae.2